MAMVTPRASQRLQSEDAFAARELLSSPPAAPKIARLSLALQRGNYQAVTCALDDDPSAALVPINGCEPPLVYAVQHGCQAPILELLLESGAAINDVGTARQTALEIFAGTRSASNTLASFARLALPVDRSWQGVADMPAFNGAFAAFWSSLPDPLHGACNPMPFEVPAVPAKPQICPEVAMLLLRHGAKPLRAAEFAQQEGHTQLAALIQHWSGMEARELLEAHWQRWDEAHCEGSCNLMSVPADLRGRLCDFLAPASWELLSGNK